MLAVALSAGMVYLAAAYAHANLHGFFDGADAGLRVYFVTNALQLFLAEGLGLSGLVALSSWAAVGKYLKR